MDALLSLYQPASEALRTNLIALRQNYRKYTEDLPFPKDKTLVGRILALNMSLLTRGGPGTNIPLAVSDRLAQLCRHFNLGGKDVEAELLKEMTNLCVTDNKLAQATRVKDGYPYCPPKHLAFANESLNNMLEQLRAARPTLQGMHHRQVKGNTCNVPGLADFVCDALEGKTDAYTQLVEQLPSAAHMPEIRDLAAQFLGESVEINNGQHGNINKQQLKQLHRSIREAALQPSALRGNRKKLKKGEFDAMILAAIHLENGAVDDSTRNEITALTSFNAQAAASDPFKKLFAFFDGGTKGAAKLALLRALIGNKCLTKR